MTAPKETSLVGPGADVQLAYSRWPGPGTPIVCIHGLTANRLFFGGFVERLNGRRGVVAADLRGRGDSDKPSGPYGIATHADDVAALMKSLGLGPTVVVGHSLGAYIATALTAAHPELVSGLVLIDGGYTPELPLGVTLDLLQKTYLQPILDRLEISHPSAEAHRATWRKYGLFRPEEWTSWVEDYIAHGVGGAPPALREKALGEAARVDFVDMTQRAEVEARLGAVRCPAMLIRATEGYVTGDYPIVSQIIAGQIRTFMPQAEEHVIQGATHYTILLADPGATRCADLVETFAGRL